MIRKSYKFRLFTNATQERELDRTLETHRRLYNRALEGKILCWETAGEEWSYVEQCRWLAVHRKTNPYIAAVNSTSARRTLRKLDRAYSAFFRRVKVGGKPGFPRFKSADRFDSFSFDTTPNGSGCRIVNGKLRLQFIGTVRVRWHREIPKAAKHREATVIRRAGKWYICFSIELPDHEPCKHSGSIGIDVGLKAFVTTSSGECLGDSRSLERALPELRQRQRALNRCKRGSNRRSTVKNRVMTLHQKVANCRRDLHHKVARSLVDRYRLIVAESLNIQGMLRNRRLSRRISDAGWYSFIQILISKAESAGVQVTLVDAKNTSQACSQCGQIVKKGLSVRTHRCVCGLVIDRDVNAARNILARAERSGANLLDTAGCP